MWNPPGVKWHRGDRKVFFAQLLLQFGGTVCFNLLLLSVGIVVAVRRTVVAIVLRSMLLTPPHTA